MNHKRRSSQIEQSFESELQEYSRKQKFYTFRKSKSLPNLRKKLNRQSKSKTICQLAFLRCIPVNESLPNKDDCQHNMSNDSTRPSSFETCSNSASMYSFQSTNIPSLPKIANDQIDVINCDDIKIWFDQSCDSKQENNNRLESSSSSACATENLPIPLKRQTERISPLNSVLSNVFSTSQNSTKTIENEYLSYNQFGVFDSFLPKCGEKIRPNHSQNPFDDTVECISNERRLSSTNASSPSQNEQSLKNFLQSSQFSRHNTELEKENAHFRVSEAIISAMEHIKWDKVEPDKLRCSEETVATAIDCIETRNDNGKDNISYAEVGECCLDLLSAEVVGLSLISKFNENHLPKVSDLKWLISDEDTPQSLLPMPSNIPTLNPDDSIMPSITRGTKYWAPPRQQIIFTDHPSPNRKKLIEKQNNRCAGCGMRVSVGYISSFRYCTYLGKYFCTGCHRNQISPTPAKIIHMWDFKSYPVSAFAYRLLEQMWTFPLFYVPALNPDLYKRSTDISTARLKRIQLKYMKDFISTCRFAATEQKYFESIPNYNIMDPDLWSISDFFDARNKSIQYTFIMSTCEAHILNCVLCAARGFICEICRKDEIIYPWGVKTFRCNECGVCFHKKCWESMKNENCYRCQRIENRRQEKILSGS